VHHDEAYIDGPSNSTLPDHWRNFSEAAAAAARGSSTNTAGGSGGRRAGLSHQDSQVLGLAGSAAAAAQPVGADGGRVSLLGGGCHASAVGWCVAVDFSEAVAAAARSSSSNTAGGNGGRRGA
jgi:hypothetical protein